jgi:hypothetical protein
MKIGGDSKNPKKNARSLQYKIHRIDSHYEIEQKKLPPK